VHVFVDDSGDGGLKFASGSTSHLVMAACVFRDPLQIEELAARAEECRAATSHRHEFKYNATREKVKDDFFARTAPVRFHVRAICIDKARLTSAKLRSEPQALKSYAIRMLLTKNYGYIRDAKVFIDGHDTKAFGVGDGDYLMRMVNRESPGTIRAVRFVDSKVSIGIQLADMTAGAINRGVRTNKPANTKHLALLRPRTYQPSGSLWHFCSP
jgi:hypothetical protein